MVEKRKQGSFPGAVQCAAMLLLFAAFPRIGSAEASGPGQPRDKVVISVAETLLGTPYVWGGNGPKGIDCSGLVQYAYRKAGVQVPRTAAQQHEAAAPVDISQIRPGDLLFFEDEGRVSHVALYVGENRFIHAPSTGKVVSYSNVDNSYWKERLTGAGRF